MDEEEVVVDETATDDSEEEELVEEIDPLNEALTRAENAEKEISYRDAEIQNVRKRLMSEKSTAIQYGGMGMARKMLSILSDIDRALSVNEDEGLTLIRTKMWSELSGDGVSNIPTKGEKFDPKYHQAMFEAPVSGTDKGTIIQVMTKGFKIGDRLLRASQVGVSSNDSSPVNNPDTNTSDKDSNVEESDGLAKEEVKTRS